MENERRVSEHSIIVEMLSISTDFDEFIEEHELSLPPLNLSNIREVGQRLNSGVSISRLDKLVEKYIELSRVLNYVN